MYGTAMAEIRRDLLTNQATEVLIGRALQPGPGEYRINVLAEELGVSRTPIREGLRTLEMIGLYEVRWGSTWARFDGPADIHQRARVLSAAIGAGAEPRGISDAARIISCVGGSWGWWSWRVLARWVRVAHLWGGGSASTDRTARSCRRGFRTRAVERGSRRGGGKPQTVVERRRTRQSVRATSRHLTRREGRDGGDGRTPTSRAQSASAHLLQRSPAPRWRLPDICGQPPREHPTSTSHPGSAHVDGGRRGAVSHGGTPHPRLEHAPVIEPPDAHRVRCRRHRYGVHAELGAVVRRHPRTHGTKTAALDGPPDRLRRERVSSLLRRGVPISTTTSHTSDRTNRH